MTTIDKQTLHHLEYDQLRDYYRLRMVALALEAAEDYPDEDPADVFSRAAMSERVRLTYNADGTYNIHEDEDDPIISAGWKLTEADGRKYSAQMKLSWDGFFAGSEPMTFAEMGYSEAAWIRAADCIDFWGDAALIVSDLEPLPGALAAMVTEG